MKSTPLASFLFTVISLSTWRKHVLRKSHCPASASEGDSLWFLFSNKVLFRWHASWHPYLLCFNVCPAWWVPGCYRYWQSSLESGWNSPEKGITGATFPLSIHRSGPGHVRTLTGIAGLKLLEGAVPQTGVGTEQIKKIHVYKCSCGVYFPKFKNTITFKRKRKNFWY